MLLGMFTGIIQQKGKIKEIKKSADITSMLVEYKKPMNLDEGDSLNLNGVCSTVTQLSDNSFKVEYMPETLEKTNISYLKENDKINIEPALKASDKLNGHLVTGHIDGTGKILDIKDEGSSKEFKISYSDELSKFIAFKGSITVEGISLTVSLLEDGAFSVSLIPYTLDNTTFGGKKKGDPVNLEVDIISRYLKRLFDERDKQSNYEFLKERGFI
jgi:riboflavin synthase